MTKHETLTQEETDSLIAAINEMDNAIKEKESHTEKKSYKIRIHDFANGCELNKFHLRDIQEITEKAVSNIKCEYDLHVASVDQLHAENLYYGFLHENKQVESQTVLFDYAFFKNALLTVSSKVLATTKNLIEDLVLELDSLWRTQCPYVEVVPIITHKHFWAYDFMSKHSTEHYILVTVSVEEKDDSNSTLGFIDIIYPIVDLLKVYSTNPLQQSMLGKAAMNVDVKLGSCVKTLNEVQNFEEGTILTLNEKVCNPLVISVGGVPYAEGEAITVDGNYGIRITKVYESES